ncbi:MAG: VOC family protein [Proteobacteria bacterium]|nr:VOC family protein [Pseudomonadota bacterium]
MILFEDLLKAHDFSQAINTFAGKFISDLNLPNVYQLGLVVPDVEKAAKKLEDQGIGPFFIATGSPVFWNERGEHRKISGKMGLAYYNGVELELLEPVIGSDFYTRSLDPDKRIVLQHVGFLVKDVDAWADKAANAGMPVYIRGQLKAWPSTTDFAYLEPLKENGLVMEFINWRMFGLNISPPPRLLKTVGRLEKWSGKRSIAL